MSSTSPRRSNRRRGRTGHEVGGGGGLLEAEQDPLHIPINIHHEHVEETFPTATPPSPIEGYRTEEVEGEEEEDDEEMRKKWLHFPQSVLNRSRTVKELLDVQYIRGDRPDRDEDLDGDEDDNDDDGWETLSESDGVEWEEQLVFVELEDVPSVQELFAVQPNEFLRFNKKRGFMKAQPAKPTYPKLTMKFHEFHSSKPVLQIGNRYFACSWEEPVGTSMFFRKKGDAPVILKHEAGKGGGGSRKNASSTLRSILPEPSIPWDPVFGSENLITKDKYEPVAIADKVLRTQLMEADKKRLTDIPVNRQFFGIPGSYKCKLPQGYSATDLMAGQYRKRRTYISKRRKEQEEEDDVEDEEEDQVQNKGSSIKKLDIPPESEPMDIGDTS